MSTEFGINFTEKAFGILSSTIYSNKLLAPIRELSTNAWDANVDNGKDGWDFSVHIPKTAIDEFYIRDFGLGINKADMLSPDGIFTTYFKSTKEDGTKTGFMGLGSKSPFALTSVFYVTSWCENYKRVYQLDNSSGKPAIFLKEETPSTEPTGLKVSFRIPAVSMANFEYEAKKFYSLWEKKPKLNLENFNDVHTVKIGSESYRYTSGTGELIMLMGNTPYSVQLNQLPTKYRNLFGRMSHKIIFDAPLGSLNFTASREVLESTAPTLKFISDKLEAIAGEIKKECLQHNTKKHFTWLKESPNDPLSLALSSLFPGEFSKSLYGSYNYFASGPTMRGYYKGKYTTRQLMFGDDVQFLQYTDIEKEVKFTGSKMKYHSEQNPDIFWVLLNEQQVKDHEKYTDQDLGNIKSIDQLPKRPRAKSVSTKPRAPRKTYINGVYTKSCKPGYNYPIIHDYNPVNRTHRVTSLPSGQKYYIFLDEHTCQSSVYRATRYDFLHDILGRCNISIKDLYIIDPCVVDFSDETEWKWFGDVITECIQKVGLNLLNENYEKDSVSNLLRDLRTVGGNYVFARHFSDLNPAISKIQQYYNNLKNVPYSSSYLHAYHASLHKPKLSNKYSEFHKETTDILNFYREYNKEVETTKTGQFQDWLTKKIINKEKLPWKV